MFTHCKESRPSFLFFTTESRPRRFLAPAEGTRAGKNCLKAWATFWYTTGGCRLASKKREMVQEPSPRNPLSKKGSPPQKGEEQSLEVFAFWKFLLYIARPFPLTWLEISLMKKRRKYKGIEKKEIGIKGIKGGRWESKWDGSFGKLPSVMSTVIPLSTQP